MPRPRSTTSAHIIDQARRLVEQVGVAEFSVRELAKSLGLAPGTIHARFGNKDELLARLYLERVQASCRLLDDLDPSSCVDVASYLESVATHLPALRRDFVLYFERSRPSGPHLSVKTWERLETEFRLLSGKVYQRFREAARAESVRVTAGSDAERLLWTVASTLDSARADVAFSHSEAGYRQFAARALLAGLRRPRRGPTDLDTSGGPTTESKQALVRSAEKI